MLKTEFSFAPAICITSDEKMFICIEFLFKRFEIVATIISFVFEWLLIFLLNGIDMSARWVKIMNTKRIFLYDSQMGGACAEIENNSVEWTIAGFNLGIFQISKSLLSSPSIASAVALSIHCNICNSCNICHNLSYFT
jgi:hypothetical protein